MKCKKGYKKSGDKCVKTNPYSKKKKFKWTSTKVIVTILIVAFFLFVLFQAGAFDKIIDTLTTSVVSDIPSSSSSFGGGELG